MVFVLFPAAGVNKKQQQRNSFDEINVRKPVNEGMTFSMIELV